MASKKHDFLGKEVADAIKKACETLKVPQEQLDIEVLETGSTGIFGLIRKKAKIRVAIKEDNELEDVEPALPPEEKADDELPPAPQVQEAVPVEKPEETPETPEAAEDVEKEKEIEAQEETDASSESVEIVKAELTHLIELMGYPSSVEVSAEGMAIHCAVSGEHQKELAGPEGKTLDSIQYIIRKIAARKCAERLRISVNVGTFREERLEELKARAVELAAQVKENGKTQVLPALNPSERREIHMVLQEDKEVRSRSVGDGLFKKILIYKPGKTARGGRRKPGGRNNRRGKPSRAGEKAKKSEE